MDTTNNSLNCNWDFQTVIATLDRTVMESILTTQFYTHGVYKDVACCRHKGVPLYLIRCKNGVSYVCTKGQALYFISHLDAYGTSFEFTDDATAFRVFPETRNAQHKDRGAQYGVQYVSLSKNREFTAPIVLPL